MGDAAVLWGLLLLPSLCCCRRRGGARALRLFSTLVKTTSFDVH